ncbi:MAG: energy transducer TonB [Bacteroidota bacterium]
MPKETKEKHFVKKPVYEGGLKAMRQFIRQNLQYPKAALEQRIEGTVYLKYNIDYQGNVKEVKVISSLGYGCDEEAMRLVKLLRFKVGKIRKGKILFHKNIQIHFKLTSAPTAQPTALQVNYHYTQKSKKEPESPSKNTGYTIRW